MLSQEFLLPGGCDSKMGRRPVSVKLNVKTYYDVALIVLRYNGEYKSIKAIILWPYVGFL